MLLQQKEGTISMPQTIEYEEKHFIIINDIENSLFYFFDFDVRSTEKNMEFEHLHSYYEIHILLSPMATHFIEGIPYRIRTNDFVLLEPSRLHKSFYPSETPSKRLVITFMYRDDGYGFKDTYENLLTPFHDTVPIFRFPESQQEVLVRILNEIVALSRQAGAQEMTGAYELMVHSLFTQFLYYLKAFHDYNIYETENPQDRLSERIYTVANHIHTHYMDNLTLEGLAKSIYMDPFYLSHQFREVTGYTITQYIHLVRIRNCQFLLLNTEDKITDISSACGFTSFSQFNRVFHKFCNESPSEYRKSQSTGRLLVERPKPLRH